MATQFALIAPKAALGMSAIVGDIAAEETMAESGSNAAQATSLVTDALLSAGFNLWRIETSSVAVYVTREADAGVAGKRYLVVPGSTLHVAVAKAGEKWAIKTA